MTSEQRTSLRILTIEPVGCDGHKSFNNFFLRCFKVLGHVTYVAPERFLDSCGVDSRINIPEFLLRHKTKVGARWSAIRVLSYILKNVRLDDFDVIVFLSYETISFSVRWPKSRKVFLFEHNNIENAQGSRIKTFFYNRIAATAVRLAFQNPSVQFIRKTTGGDTVQIPHPYYRRDVSNAGIDQGLPSAPFPGRRIIIFSPSGSTPQFIQDELKTLASTTRGAFYAICKGEADEKTGSWEVCPYFKNYEELMRSCDMVFLGVRFDNRISGVVFEALSFGNAYSSADSLSNQSRNCREQSNRLRTGCFLLRHDAFCDAGESRISRNLSWLGNLPLLRMVHGVLVWCFAIG